MEKVNAFIKISTLLPDKLAHFLVCLFGSIVFTAGFGIGAGLAAEFKDVAHGGKWSWGDITADIAGTLVGGIINILIVREIWKL